MARPVRIVGPSNSASKTRSWRAQPTQGWRMIEGMRGGCYCNLSPGAASSLDEGDEMTTTVQDIIAGVEVLTIVTECYGGGGPVAPINGVKRK